MINCVLKVECTRLYGVAQLPKMKVDSLPVPAIKIYRVKECWPISFYLNFFKLQFLRVDLCEIRGSFVKKKKIFYQ